MKKVEIKYEFKFEKQQNKHIESIQKKICSVFFPM